MRLDLTGRRVLISGAARGIGAAIVAEFLEAGAEVLAVDIAKDALEMLAAAHSEAPLEIAALNLADPSVVHVLCQSREIDILVHAAGGVCGQGPTPIEAVTDENWASIYDANVTTALNLVRVVVPGMKSRRRGRIVTISSGAGLKPSLTGIQAYCSAKHALVGLTRQLALELGPHEITVNSVAPGFLRTSPDYERQWDSYGPEVRERMLSGIALRRLGEPADIAAACVFLASDRAGFITGQVLPVSGHPFP